MAKPGHALLKMAYPTFKGHSIYYFVYGLLLFSAKFIKWKFTKSELTKSIIKIIGGKDDKREECEI